MKELSHNFGNSVIIYEGAEMAQNVNIGPYTIIYPNVKISENVTIRSSSIIGKPPTTGKNQMKLSDFEEETIISNGTFVGDQAIIYKGCIIGENCYIADKALIREGVRLSDEVVIGTSAVVSFNAKVGKRSKIMTGTNISGNMVIGDDCFIGVLVCAVNDNTPSVAKPRVEQKGGRVGDRVVIGSNSTILPNVKIEDDITVAAGSIISRSLTKPNSVYMGSPAKFIKPKK